MFIIHYNGKKLITGDVNTAFEWLYDLGCRDDVLLQAEYFMNYWWLLDDEFDNQHYYDGEVYIIRTED